MSTAGSICDEQGAFLRRKRGRQVQTRPQGGLGLGGKRLKPIEQHEGKAYNLAAGNYSSKSVMELNN